jgi:hypothetical protein
MRLCTPGRKGFTRIIGVPFTGSLRTSEVLTFAG